MGPSAPAQGGAAGTDGRAAVKGATTATANRVGSGRQLELGFGQSLDLLDRGGHRRRGGVRSKSQLLGVDEGDVVDAGEAEQGPKVRLLMVEAGGRAFAIEASTRLDD